LLAYATLDDASGVAVSLHGPGSATAVLVSADGLVGLPGVRSVVTPRPNGHGSINRTLRLSDRVVTLSGEVWGSDQAAAYAEFDKVQGALYAALDTPRTLRYRRGVGGVDLQMDVRLDSDVKAPLAGHSRFIKYDVQLRASDPRAYSQEVFLSQSVPMGLDGGGFTFPATWPRGFVPGSAGFAPFSNPGLTPTPPVFRLNGRLVNPRIRLMPNGPELIFAGTVDAGAPLTVDVARRTALLPGGASRLYLLDFSGGSRWFELPGGDRAVRLLADDADPSAFLEVFYRHAYS
jgi:hypothetical protein